MSNWTPADYIELVKAMFFGIGAVCMPLATAYVMIGAARAKRSVEASLQNAKSISDVSDNVSRVEKNTNSLSERNQAIAMKLGITEGIATGRQQGADEAAKLLEGQRQRAETERASVAAAAAGTPQDVSPLSKKI